MNLYNDERSLNKYFFSSEIVLYASGSNIKNPIKINTIFRTGIF